MRMKLLALPTLAAALTIGAPAKAEGEVALVQQHIDAYRAKNMDAFLATFAPDAVLTYEGMVFRGRQQIAQAFALNFAPDAPRMYIVDSGSDGRVVYMQSGYVFGDGTDICCGYSEYRVEGGQIVSLTVSGPN